MSKTIVKTKPRCLKIIAIKKLEAIILITNSFMKESNCTIYPFL